MGLCGSAWARSVSDSGTSPETEDTANEDTSDTAVPGLTTVPATTTVGETVTSGGYGAWHGGYNASDLAGEPGGNAWEGACNGADGSSNRGGKGKAALILGVLLFAGRRRQ
jgi:hypothetical protein